MCLLAAEITKTTGIDPEHYQLESEFGAPVYRRIDAPADLEQKNRLKKLSEADVEPTNSQGNRSTDHGGGAGAHRSVGSRSRRRTDGLPLPGTEDIYKIYAELQGRITPGTDHVGRTGDRGWRARLIDSPAITRVSSPVDHPVGESTIGMEVDDRARGWKLVPCPIPPGSADRVVAGVGHSGTGRRPRDGCDRTRRASRSDASGRGPDPPHPGIQVLQLPSRRSSRSLHRRSRQQGWGWLTTSTGCSSSLLERVTQPGELRLVEPGGVGTAPFDGMVESSTMIRQPPIQGVVGSRQPRPPAHRRSRGHRARPRLLVVPARRRGC